MKKTLLAFLICLVLASIGYGQTTTDTAHAEKFLPSIGKTSLGLGMGFPYGGFGTNLTYRFPATFEIFGGAGYNLVGLGYNLGLNVYFPSTRQVEFYLTGMYGYNAVTKIKNLPDANDIYYGPTVGAGIKLKSQRTPGIYWSFSLLLPIRNAEYRAAVDLYSKSPLIENFRKASPVGISIGYHFRISENLQKEEY